MVSKRSGVINLPSSAKTCDDRRSVAPGAIYDGGLAVRLLPLEVDESELRRLQSFLSAEEMLRGNRLLDPQRRNAFFAGRGMLREMLAGMLHLEPVEVRLVEGRFGKPQLQEENNPSSIRFNVSHAGRYLLAAFAAGREVGVDLEQLRPELSYRAMAQRYFSQREQEELFGLAQDRQIEAFYRCWTRKEAYMKGTGTGFSQPSTSFDVTLLPDTPPALLAHRASPEETGRWSIEDISVPEGYCAALAMENLTVKPETISHGENLRKSEKIRGTGSP